MSSFKDYLGSLQVRRYFLHKYLHHMFFEHLSTFKYFFIPMCDNFLIKWTVFEEQPRCSTVYMSSSFWLLGVESCDFSHAEKERTAYKAEKIHKITTIFTQNGPRFKEAYTLQACAKGGADQMAPQGSGSAPHYYLPPQIFRLWHMPGPTKIVLLTNYRPPHDSKSNYVFFWR